MSPIGLAFTFFWTNCLRLSKCCLVLSAHTITSPRSLTSIASRLWVTSESGLDYNPSMYLCFNLIKSFLSLSELKRCTINLTSRLRNVFFLNVGPLNEDIFLTTFYALYFSHHYTLHITNCLLGL